jgi:hypothetical protein
MSPNKFKIGILVYVEALFSSLFYFKINAPILRHMQFLEERQTFSKIDLEHAKVACQSTRTPNFYILIYLLTNL